MQSIDFNIFARIITEMIRKCFFCWSAKVVRNGLGGRKQQYINASRSGRMENKNCGH